MSVFHALSGDIAEDTFEDHRPEREDSVTYKRHQKDISNGRSKIKKSNKKDLNPIWSKIHDRNMVPFCVFTTQ